MAAPRHKLGRAKKRLRRFLAQGWQRAAFAPPGAPEEAEVYESAAAPAQEDEPVFEQAFQALLAAAASAAERGLVKQTFILDEDRRVELDARHGIPRGRRRDEQTRLKQMGGKERALRPDKSAELLRQIGIMNADGSISAKHARKYKQVNHLVELIRPSWTHIAQQRELSTEAPLRVLDLACGNSVLAFVLSELARIEGFGLRLHGVDLRDELVDQNRRRAAQLERPELSFSQGRIEDAAREAVERLGGEPELVLSLHACDTATDAALLLAIERGAAEIFCVPCCQAELARQLRPEDCPLPSLGRQGLLRRAWGELLTDALRVEALEACGYSVSVVEFVDSEHTHKNLLLRARRQRQGPVDPSRWELGELETRAKAMGVRPTLVQGLLDSAAPNSLPPQSPG